MSENSGQDKVTLKVEDVMTMDVITIDENSSVKKAAETMSQYTISCLIVAGKSKAIGIITETDLLKRVIVEGKNAKKKWGSHVESSGSRCAWYKFGRCFAGNVSKENQEAACC